MPNLVWLSACLTPIWMCRSNWHPLFCVCFLGTWGACLSTLNLRYFNHNNWFYHSNILYYSFFHLSSLYRINNFLFQYFLSFKTSMYELLCHAHLILTHIYAKNNTHLCTVFLMFINVFHASFITHL